MSLSSMMRFCTMPSLQVISGARPKPDPAAGRLLAKAFLGQVRDSFVIVGRHEAGTSIDIDRAQAVDDLLAERQDRHIALQERLLVGSELDPAVLERLDDLRAGIEP